jgi:hypothetical protein
MDGHPDDVERSDADPRLIAAIALGIAVFLAGTPYFLYAGYPSAVRTAGIEPDLPRPPPPVLDVHPAARLLEQRSRENASLGSYGWADRERHVARVPIDRAMQLLAERGLAGWPSAANSRPPAP